MGCLSKKTVKAINSIIEEASVVVLRFNEMVRNIRKKVCTKERAHTSSGHWLLKLILWLNHL
jgi:wobble nucleotide-excising tRNase